MKKTIIDWILRIYGILMILWGLLSYFNWMPFYQVELHKTNSITPRVNLFPGQRVRLNFDFHEPRTTGDISAVRWSISKDKEVLYREEGLEPTVTLPPVGGTYQLRVIATMDDNSAKTGQSNIYVVQDTPKQVKKFLPQAKVDLTTENTIVWHS